MFFFSIDKTVYLGFFFYIKREAENITRILESINHVNRRHTDNAMTINEIREKANNSLQTTT